MRIPKISNPKQITASFTPKVFEYIEAEALRQDVPKSAVIRGLVNVGILHIHPDYPEDTEEEEEQDEQSHWDR